jgi:hypothetical protein
METLGLKIKMITSNKIKVFLRICCLNNNNVEGGKQDFRICIEFYLRFVTSVILPPAKKHVTL